MINGGAAVRFFLPRLMLADGERLAGDSVYDRHRLFFVFQLGFAVCIAVVAGGELTAVRGLHQRLDRPIFLRYECTDLILAIHDQTCCNALYTTGGQAALDLAPQERRELIAHDAVQNTARLLGVDQINVNIARVLDARANRLLGDLVKGHTSGILVLELEQLLDVPRNRFSLAVRVSCEVHEIALADFAADFLNNFIFSLDRHIFRLEIVLDVNAHFLFRQIAQMSHRRLDNIVRTEILPDGLCLGRRLHDD